MLQYGVLPPHCPLFAQPVTQRCVPVSQTRPPSPQSTVLTHCTQRLVVVSQRGRKAEFEQFVSLVHCTQSIVDVLQAGVPPPADAHWVSLVHETTHRFVAGLQTMPPSPQLALVRHWTHAPDGEQ